MLCNRIKMLRESKGITKTQASRDLGVPYTTYYNYENAVCEPSASMLVKIALYYSVSTDWLLGCDDALLSEDEHLKTIENQLESLSVEKLEELKLFLNFLLWKD